ncbi:hypothetical protein JEO96_05650 [Proteus mirabilis]|nr:hypothetical protein [Proteus mirabilis]
MSLFLTIIFTSIFCVLALLPIGLTMNNRISENKKNTNTENEISKEKRPLFSLDERNLQSQPMFWSAIASPLIVGVLLFAIISPNYDLNFTVDAYKTFMEIAQLPSVILALSPILGAFVVYAHRSYQTDIQIKTAREQLKEAQNKNKIDAYISNVKFTIDMLSSVETPNRVKIKNAYRLYSSAYILKSEHLNIINDFFLSSLNKKIDNINERISEINKFGTENGLKSQNVLNIVRGSFESILTSVNKIENILNIELEYNYYDISNNLPKSVYYSNESENENENNQDNLFENYLRQRQKLFLLLDDIGELIYKIIIILFPKEDEHTLLPGIQILYNEIQQILRPYHNYGDKVATENQNNHE